MMDADVKGCASPLWSKCACEMKTWEMEDGAIPCADSCAATLEVVGATGRNCCTSEGCTASRSCGECVSMSPYIC